MNIIITLPDYLIEKIETGKKTVELRKTIAKHFHPQEDVVYICQKGTKSVVGYLVISHIVRASNWVKVWNDYHEEIAVDLNFYMKYASEAENLYLYHIEKFVRFPRPYSLLAYFSVFSAPQSFAYTSIRLFDRECR